MGSVVCLEGTSARARLVTEGFDIPGWNGELSRIPDTEPHPTVCTLDGPRLHWEVLLPSWPLEASADPQLRSLRGPVPQELFVEAEI